MSDTIENSTFELLDKINVNEYTKGKGQFTYLSWAWAVRELLKVKPKSTWRVHKFGIDENERPYMQTDAGCFVQVSLTVDGVTRSQIHPVLDNVNKTNSKKYQKAIETLESICEVNNVWLKENK